jgi:hypothetical protein
LSVEREVSPPAPSGLGRPRTCPQDLSPPPRWRLAGRAARVRDERARASRRTGAARPAVGFVCQMLAPTEHVLSCGSMGSRSPVSNQARGRAVPGGARRHRTCSGRVRLAMLLCSRREAVPAADLGPARAASGALLVQMLHAHTNAAI